MIPALRGTSSEFRSSFVPIEFLENSRGGMTATTGEAGRSEQMAPYHTRRTRPVQEEPHGDDACAFHPEGGSWIAWVASQVPGEDEPPYTFPSLRALFQGLQLARRPLADVVVLR